MKYIQHVYIFFKSFGIQTQMYTIINTLIILVYTGRADSGWWLSPGYNKLIN